MKIVKKNCIFFDPGTFLLDIWLLSFAFLLNVCVAGSLHMLGKHSTAVPHLRLPGPLLRAYFFVKYICLLDKKIIMENYN